MTHQPYHQGDYHDEVRRRDAAAQAPPTRRSDVPTHPPSGPFYTCEKCRRTNPPDALRWVWNLWHCASCSCFSDDPDLRHDWDRAPTLSNFLRVQGRRCSSAVCDEPLCPTCQECPKGCGFFDHERNPHEDCVKEGA